MEQVRASSLQNKNPSSSMVRERDNDNDEYYVPIKTRSGWRIVNSNPFGQASEIAIGLLTCQCNDFLQTSRPGSIETIKNELANVSIFKANMEHMDMTSRNYDEIFINFSYRRILVAENSQKDNLHLGEARKADNREEFMKAMKKEIKYLTAEDVWKYFQNNCFQHQHTQYD